jgi:hypothetical protein
MDLMNKTPMHETNVKIPIAEAQWIKEQGMTYAGAFRRGIEAIREVVELRAELHDVRKNFEACRNRMIKAEAKIDELSRIEVH